MDKEDRLISAPEATRIFGLKSRATWYSWVKHDPEAPKPVIQTNKFSRWLLSDVMAYMRVRIDRYQASIGAK